MSTLNSEQLKRYQRNILLTDVGEEGQQKLLSSKVLVVGAGGLGSPVAFYLAAAGIGTLGIIDDDVVELSNLQRQIIHNTDDVGKLKVYSATEKAKALNSDISVVTYKGFITEDNATQILAPYHLVVDATDNYNARQIINKTCVKLKKPFVYGGVLAMQGQVMSILPGQGPCFSCIFPQAPLPNAPTTSTVGVLGAVPGVIGSMQVAETIKILLGIGQPLVGRLLSVDLLNMSCEQVEVKRDPHCPVCGS